MAHGFDTTPDDLRLWFSNPADQSLRWAKAVGHEAMIKPIHGSEKEFIPIKSAEPIKVKRRIQESVAIERKERLDYAKFKMPKLSKEFIARRKKRQAELAAANPGYADWLARGGADRPGVRYVDEEECE